MSFPTLIRLVLPLAPLILPAACSGDHASGSAAKAPVRPPAAVTVATVKIKPMPVQLSNIGNVEAYATISVKAQINGELTQVNFQQGQQVKKGDLLFRIDPRPYDAALKQAEADLAKDKAQKEMAKANVIRDRSQLQNAEIDARRYASVVAKGAVTKEAYEKLLTDAETLQGHGLPSDEAAVENAEQAIQGAHAAIDTAKVNLDYCTIRSPINGQTGSLLVNQGNLVKANDVPIMVDDQSDRPIYVDFPVPEQYLGEIKQHMSEGDLKGAGVHSSR